MITSHAVRRLLALLYLAGLLVLADQLADLAATVLAQPWLPGQANWRFGAFGLLMTRASVFLIADVMLFAAAIGLGHRRVLRGLGMLHLLLTLLLLAGLGSFILDWLQMRARMPNTGARSFDLAGIRAAAMAALTIVLTGWAGMAALRATRPKPPHRDGEAAPLLTAIRRSELTS